MDYLIKQTTVAEAELYGTLVPIFEEDFPADTCMIAPFSDRMFRYALANGWDVHETR